MRYAILIGLLLALGPYPAQAQDGDTAEVVSVSARPTARPATATAAAATDKPASDFGGWLQGFRARALAQGISAGTTDAALARARYMPDIIRLDRNQSEFTKTIWDYLDTAVSDLRIRNGRRALDRYSDALERIEQIYGVEKEIVVAIWGVESSYGAFRGSTGTIPALATLAFDARRAEFFEGELLAALRILDEGEVTPERMEGSWAGAMGHTQFIPTSYLAHAQDYDGDGRRNVWGDDPRDALASTAAYLAHFGWQTGQPWGVEVTLPDDFDYRQTGEPTTKSASEWVALGVKPVSGGTLPMGDGISIRVPAGHTGAAFATYPNFRVIERYNTADAYVIGVGHLANRIAGGPGIQATWPRQDRALSFEERVGMQRSLAANGFDPQKFDGKVGPLTLEAIRQFQAANGLVPDGYANQDFLNNFER